MANYSLVADYSFRPFTFDEMVKPMLMYKDEYNKRLEDYLELNKNTDVFSYLSQTLPEDSKARQLYEGYANAKNAAFEDFSRNGLNINNKRALVDLKRRYQGEIGRLEKADEALKKEREARAEIRRKDPSMLYANDNISIDDFLDNNEPNLYSISGNDLYTQAANASAKMSSRIFGAKDNGRILGNYYRDYLTTMGYTPEQVATFSREMQDRINADFTQRVSTLPELQDAAVRLLESQGVINTATGETNLKGVNLRRAQQQVIRGLVDGAVYQESHKPIRDESVMSAYQGASLEMEKEKLVKNAALHGLSWNNTTKSWDYDPTKDPSKKVNANTPSGSKSSTGDGTQLSNTVILEWDGNDPAESYYDPKITGKGSSTEDITYDGTVYNYDDLPEYARKQVDKYVKDGKYEYYDYYFLPYSSGRVNDTEAKLYIVPRDRTVKRNSSQNTGSSSGDGDDDV